MTIASLCSQGGWWVLNNKPTKIGQGDDNGEIMGGTMIQDTNDINTKSNRRGTMDNDNDEDREMTKQKMRGQQQPQGLGMGFHYQDWWVFQAGVLCFLTYDGNV